MNIAYAMGNLGAPSSGGNQWMSFLPLILLFVVFYFLLIRPQQKKAKQQKQFIENLKKGDEVVSGGGVLGRITEIGENFVQLEIAEGVQIRIQKQAISSLMPKGTYKGNL